MPRSLIPIIPWSVCCFTCYSKSHTFTVGFGYGEVAAQSVLKWSIMFVKQFTQIWPYAFPIYILSYIYSDTQPITFKLHFSRCTGNWHCTITLLLISMTNFWSMEEYWWGTMNNLSYQKCYDQLGKLTSLKMKKKCFRIVISLLKC